nr:baseplate J/gp47 family protein [Acetobacter sp. DmW_043]
MSASSTTQQTSYGTTSVPAPRLSSSGFVMPQEAEVLAGVLADINAAFGNQLSLSLSTPQGQLAVSMTAILGDAYDQFLAVANGVDPARATGRMQDAIGRLYFMTRQPATATVVACVCTGTSGTVIPQGSLVQDTSGNSYAASAAITLDETGTATGNFVCTVAGETACPAQSIRLSQALNGWATVTNPVAGVTGRNTEGRIAFERRRQVSVSLNSVGVNNAIQASVQAVPGVLDAYVTDNSTGSAVTIKGVTLAAHSVYVCVSGGSDDAVARAILSKKPPGCAYTGTTQVQVNDTDTAYSKAPVYNVSFQRAKPVAVYVNVKLSSSLQVPADVQTQVRKAVLASFLGLDGGARAGIGSVIYASRFYSPVAALGSWAQIIDITAGPTADPTAISMALSIDQIPVLEAKNISVELA